MSNTKQITEALKDLILNDDRAFVAMLSGEWGIGKTYFWQNVFVPKHLKDKKVVYISLFGQNSLQDIETTIVTKLYEYNKNLKKYTRHLDTIGNLGSKALGLSANISIGSLLSLFTPNDFKNIVICFDDFERLSDKVPLKDVMGLISQFKEQKECKIVMILNEKELDSLSDIDGKKHADIFALYKEKIVDYNFPYNPSQEELFEAIGQDIEKIKFCNHETIYGFFRTIDLKNIRIMKQALYLLEHFSFIGDEGYDKVVIDEFVEIALNLFVFKSKTNYTMKEWNELIGYSFRKSFFHGSKSDQMELNREHDNALEHYDGNLEHIYLKEQVEFQIYSFLEKHIINEKEINRIFTDKNDHLTFSSVRRELIKINRQLYTSFSIADGDTASMLHTKIVEYKNTLHQIILYSEFEGFLGSINMYASIKINEAMEKDIIENYIKYYIDDPDRDEHGPLNESSYLEDIYDKYDWARAYAEEYSRPSKVTLEEAINIISDVVKDRQISKSEFIRLDVLDANDYKDILVKFPERIMNTVKFCSLREESYIKAIREKIKQALVVLSLENDEFKRKAQELAKHAKINLEEEK